MSGRAASEGRGSSLQVRAFYSVAELARAGNVRTYRLLRLLRLNGFAFLRAGRAFYVTLDEIQRKIPPLWRSLRLVEDVRRGACVEARDHHDHHDHRVQFDPKGRRT